VPRTMAERRIYAAGRPSLCLFAPPRGHSNSVGVSAFSVFTGCEVMAVASGPEARASGADAHQSQNPARLPGLRAATGPGAPKGSKKVAQNSGSLRSATRKQTQAANDELGPVLMCPIVASDRSSQSDAVKVAVDFSPWV